MAFSLVQNVHAGSVNSSGTTITSAALAGGSPAPAVGDLIVVFGGRDEQASDPQTDTCSDTAGNTYTKYQALAPGAVGTNQDGSSGVIFFSVLTAAWTVGAGGTTVTWTQPSVLNRCIAIRHFTAGGTIRAVAGNPFTATGTTSGTNATATNVGPGRLVVACASQESNTTPTADTDTTNGSWSTVYGANTTGGGATANAGVASQYKITTAAGNQTFNPGLAATDNTVIVATFAEGASTAARQFTASGSNRVQFSPGGFSGNTFDYGTVAAVVDHTDNGAWQDIVNLRTATGTLETHVLEVSDFDQWWFSINNGNGVNGPVVATGKYCVVVTKATGSAVPRFHIYNYATNAWAHADGNVALANGTATVTGIVVGEYPGGFDYQNGRVSAVGVYRHWVPNDAAVEAAGFHYDLDNFVAAAANSDLDWVVSFNQASTATAVEDLIGSGDQTAITGTSVSTGPAGFDNSVVGGGAAVALTGTAAATSGATGTLSVARALTGTAAATSSAAGTLGVARALSGTVSATSGATGELSVSGVVELTGTIAAQSSLTTVAYVSDEQGNPVTDEAGNPVTTGTPDLVSAVGLTGTAGATSGATGSLSVARALTGTAAAVSGATGDLTTAGGGGPVALDGTAASSSGATGVLSVARALTGTVAGSSAATGVLSVARALSGQVAASSTAAGALSAAVGLSGQADAVSGASAALGVARALTGAVVATSGASATTLVSEGELSGIAAATSGATGTLAVARALTGTATAQSGATAALAVARALSGTATAQSAATGQLGLTVNLAGTAAG